MRSIAEKNRIVARNVANGKAGATGSLVRPGVSLLLTAMFGLWGTAVLANVAPPVAIKMAADSPQAVSGEIYEGLFEVRYTHPGTMEGFAIIGEGWKILEADFPQGGYYTEPGTFLIHFKARPENADARIELHMTWDRQVVKRTFAIGPEQFERRNVVSKAVSRGPSALRLETADSDKADSGTTARGTNSFLQLKGRIVYDRAGRDRNDDGDYDDDGEVPPLSNVGVDTISWRIIDIDDFGEETIDSGVTDTYGNFDTGALDWDDCDPFGCDDPDLVLQFWTDNPNVRVEHGNGGFTPYYFWETIEIEDFTEGFKDYGDVSPLFPFEHPALHIHNSIVRTHRFILLEANFFTPKVTVVWPDPDGATTGAHYHAAIEEIHISTEREWWEATQSHEYGHHFMASFTGTIPTDYCNGFCDGVTEPGETCGNSGTLCEDPGHCDNCPENDHDALNEGWPDWLADVTTRWMEETLTNSDGSDYQVLFPRSTETVGNCCQDGVFYDQDAHIVESFVSALLRDIEDDNLDFHSWNTDADRVRRDMMCLGIDEIFEVMTSIFQPTTIQGFINAFLALYPEHAADLRFTARNVANIYSALTNWPADTQRIGPVINADSLTHAPGQGGVLPCAVMTWDAPADDSNGVCSYSYDWGPTSQVVVDEINDAVDSIACQLSAIGEIDWVGEYYFGIKAGECTFALGETAVFGPFEIGDCNSNSTMDLCDISCNHTGDATLGCTVDSSLCVGQPNCGDSQDCNGNLVPDECDVADGTSADCNQNGIPDECEVAAGTLKNWAGGHGQWSTPSGWVEGSIPVNGNDVCIQDAGALATVTYSSNDTIVPILASSESLTIANATEWPAASLTLTDPSWVDGNLTLSQSNSSLQVDTRLDVGGQFTWSGGNNSPTLPKLTGAGSTHIYGGLNIPAVGTVSLYDHDLVLEAGSTSLVQGRIGSNLNPSLTIRPGAVLDFQGTSYLINGGGTSLNVEGTLTKSVYTGSSSISAPMQNDGLVHVQDGTLQIAAASNTTGSFIGDPLTTIEFGCGGHELMPISSLTAERVNFTGGNCGARSIRGTYDVTLKTSNISGSQVFFTNEANIVNYGTSLFLPSGSTFFDAVTGTTHTFDSITASSVYFNSGDPIVTTDLTLVGGTVRGPSPITVNGLLTWPASSNIYGPGVVNSNGTLMVEGGSGQKQLLDRVLNIAGPATFAGGLGLAGVAEINNLATGNIDLQVDGNIITGTGSTLNNAGTLVKTVGTGTSTVAPVTTNTGLIEIQIGTLRFHRLTQNSGQVLLNGGDLGMYQISNPQPFNLVGGILSGTGLVTGVVNNTGGSVEPGLSAGTLTMSHNYTQTAPGQLVAELGGITPGTGYDQLVLTGSATATFGGTLRVEMINGFVPDIGAVFDVVVAPTSTGMFDTVDVIGLPADRSIRVVDNTAGIRLQVYDPLCDGIVSSLGLCPGAICPVISYTLGQDPALSFTRPDLCPTGGNLPGAVDFSEGRIAALHFDAGNVHLGITVPSDCGNTDEAFLWDSPVLASGEVHFFLARPLGAGDYGAASNGETRVVEFGDCP